MTNTNHHAPGLPRSGAFFCCSHPASRLRSVLHAGRVPIPLYMIAIPQETAGPDSGLEASLTVSRCDAILTTLLLERQRLRQRWQPKLEVVLRLLRTLPPEHEMIPSIVRVTRELLQTAGLGVVCPKCQLPATMDFRSGTRSHQMDPGSIVFQHATGTCSHPLNEPVPHIEICSTL